MTTFIEYLKGATLNEASMSRLVFHKKEHHPFAIVSACRSETPELNKKHTQEMRSMILGAGFGFNKAKGGYTEKVDGEKKEVTELSTIIYTTPDREKELRKFVEALGKKYKQDSVFFVDSEGKAFWIFTVADNFMGKPIGSTMPLGDFHPKQIGPYFTKIGKKNFSFVAESEDIVYFSQLDTPPTSIEKRGLDNMKTKLEECVNNDVDFWDTYLSKVKFYKE